MIQIMEYQHPQTQQHCLKMSANLYRAFTNREEQRFIPDTFADKSSSYLFLYRPAYNIYQTVPFEILINKKTAGAIKNNSTFVIPITGGIHELSVKI